MADPSASFAAPYTCANCGAPFTPAIGGQTLCDRCQGLTHPEPASPLQQAEVAGFRLIRELGAGRFAHSWLAEDQDGIPVVLKLLRRYAPDPNAVQRFLAEAQRLSLAKEFDHPNLARPIGGGVHLVQAFFLVYQSGGELTLADELRQRGRVLPARALELCAQVCEGLSVIHRAGLLHLDLKPANVGVTRLSDGSEQAVLLDFATSHLLSKAGVEEPGPLPLSTVAYLSPEQAAGKTPDERSDLYAVGVLLFHLVSGRLPMMGSTAEDLLTAHREQQPLRLRDAGRKVNDEMEALIGQLLAKDPAQRPESGDEAAVMMRAIMPVADTAPMEDAAEPVEDPVPVVEGPRQEPEVMPPPQVLPPAVEPALERAMLGEVPPQPPEPPPGIPRWAAFVPPRWWPLAAGGLLAATLTVTAMLLARRPAPTRTTSARPVSAPSPVPAAPPAAASKPVLPEVVVQALPRDAEPAPSVRRAEPASPYARQFDRAQKALWIGQPRAAQRILKDVLRKSLSRRDRSRASKMMGDAEARRGRRSSAASWYRKALKLADDPDDRTRIERLLGTP